MVTGKTISNYKIVRELGRGGPGEVFEAEDLILGRHVALKFLPDYLSKNFDTMKRFVREARAASALSHPNICVIHEIVEHEGRLFIAMEFMKGKTLKQLIHEQPMKTDQILELGIQIADALNEVHKIGIIHRDIKPSNIFVTDRGDAKILDFGLSKDQELDTGTDLFSFGAVLYEMVTGKQPFFGKTDEVLKTFSPKLQEIINKALQKNPSLRYQNAAEILEDLKQLKPDTAKQLSVDAIPVSMPQPASAAVSKPRRKSLYFSIGIGAIFLITLAALLLNYKKATKPSMPQSSTPSIAVQSEVPSIAVLPFTNVSGDKDQEYFSDGLAEELINDLVKIQGLRVTGRTSSFQFKGKNEDLSAIAKKLNVANILEGSVQKKGKQVKITAQLVSTTDGNHLWSQTYDKQLDDVFAVQNEIARNVAEALKVKLVDHKLSQERKGNIDAYNAFLQGRFYTERLATEDLQTATKYYQQAIEIDPNFAPAWTGLARVHRTLANRAELDPDEAYLKAREELEKAFASDENLAIAHAEMGWIKRSYDWDWTGAEASFQRALKLEPGNASVVRGAAVLRGTLGHFNEAIEMDKQALQLDPLSPGVYLNLGLHTYYAGRYDESIQAFKKALELNPELSEIHAYLARVYLFLSRSNEALAEIAKEKSPRWQSYGYALIYHSMANKQQANAALKELTEKYHRGSAFQIAQVYAFRGETDESFKWLERAYWQREGDLTYLKGDPLLKKVTNDSRYDSLLRKMNLPL